MILYFSATGNSKYVAEQLANNGERLVFIPDAIDRGNNAFSVEPGERVGIVSPTYNWTLPSITEEFLEKLELKYTVRPYLYYVGTFGTTTGAAAAMANRIMKAKGLPLTGCSMSKCRIHGRRSSTFQTGNMSARSTGRQICRSSS